MLPRSTRKVTRSFGVRFFFSFFLLRTILCILIIMSLFFLGHLLGGEEFIASDSVYGPITFTHFFVNHHYDA